MSDIDDGEDLIDGMELNFDEEDDEIISFLNRELEDDLSTFESVLEEPAPQSIDDEGLAVIIEELRATPCAKSMNFSDCQVKNIFSMSLWRRVLDMERQNVQSCLVGLERETQLSARNKRLVDKDHQLCSTISSEFISNYEKSAINELCDEFIDIARKFRYSPGFVKGLASTVKECIYTDAAMIWKEMSLPAKETLYYVSGWTVHCFAKAVKKRTKEMGKVLRVLIDTITFDESDKSQKDTLPTRKIDERSLFGGLRYSTHEYFEFVSKIEHVFCSILTEENIVIFGPLLLKKVKFAISEEPIVLKKFRSFLPANVEDSMSENVFKLFLTSYTHMRGKDFSMKLLSKHSSLKVTTRQRLAVLSNPDTYKRLDKKLKKK